MQLLECIKDIPDLRKKRGIRHPFQAVLKLLLLGFACRLVAVEHMTSFFSPIWGRLKGPLGFTRSTVPDPTTIRRIINGVKVEQIQKAFEQWVSDLVKEEDIVGSVDGKALRNEKGENGKTKVLLNVFAHDIKLALAEYAIQEKEGEPTIGLHSCDIELLLKIFHSLVDQGNTVIIIEHNLDVIANADYVIDLGPEAGLRGGEILCQGTPEEIVKHPTSYTAKYLRSSLLYN